jgi:hypothetical protein
MRFDVPIWRNGFSDSSPKTLRDRVILALRARWITRYDLSLELDFSTGSILKPE